MPNFVTFSDDSLLNSYLTELSDLQNIYNDLAVRKELVGSYSDEGMHIGRLMMDCERRYKIAFNKAENRQRQIAAAF